MRSLLWLATPFDLLGLSVKYPAILLAPMVALGVAASSPGQERPSVAALPITQPISVDGLLDEEPWARAPFASGFTQREPVEGAPATQRTRFQVIYTPSHLYVGLFCEQRQPPRLIAKEMERDAPLYRDDSVAVVLDTFADGRNGYVFETNPNGARFDALITDEGRDVNPEWDGVWAVASQRTESGWTAEFAIPFSTLRFDPSSRLLGSQRAAPASCDAGTRSRNWASLSRDDRRPGTCN